MPIAMRIDGIIGLFWVEQDIRCFREILTMIGLLAHMALKLTGLLPPHRQLHGKDSTLHLLRETRENAQGHMLVVWNQGRIKKSKNSNGGGYNADGVVQSHGKEKDL